jgi:hypothetical protein
MSAHVVMLSANEPRRNELLTAMLVKRLTNSRELSLAQVVIVQPGPNRTQALSLREQGPLIYSLTVVISFFRPRAKLALACVFGIFILNAWAQAQPANDLFANRTVLVGTNVTVNGSNVGSGTEAGENTGSGVVLLVYSVWYSWTAPTNGVLRIAGSTPQPSFFLSIGAYQGTTLANLTPAPTTPDGGVAVVAGDTIQFQVASVYYTVWGGGGGWGAFTMSLSLEIPTPTSPNDAFEDRVEITGPSFHFEGSIYGATVEPGEPLPGPGTGSTLWWKIKPDEDALLNVTAAAGQFVSSLVLYEGNQLDSLVRNDPVIGSHYRLEGGREYAIQLAASNATSGTFALDARLHSLTNDMFAGSEHIEGTNLTYHGNFTLATSEPGEPIAASNTVWVSWTAPFTGRVQYNVATSYQFQYLQLFTGSDVTDLQSVATVPLVNRWHSFLAVEGTVYHFQFSGGADDFTFTLQLAPFTPATNDMFASATVLKGQVAGSEPLSVNEATMELGEPLHRGPVPQKSLWWRWQSPVHGNAYLSAGASLVAGAVIAIYQGPDVATLTLIRKGTNDVFAPLVAGETYYIAVAVPADAVGDVAFFGQVSSPFNNPSVPVPGNLLLEPSWEGTALSPLHWHVAGEMGGFVNERGGADGTTWPRLGTGTKLWQDFTVITGRTYRVRFAQSGPSRIRVLWNQQLLGIAEDDGGYWHWSEFTVTATEANVRLMFENLDGLVNVDAFSVIDLAAPPEIVNQPVSISTVAGGTAAFIVGAKGTAPLRHQWSFNGEPLPGQTNFALILSPVTTANAGTYTVTITNAFGSVTSSPVELAVDDVTDVTILVQPQGDVVPLGGYFNLSVVALGTPPLEYQWFMGDQPVAEATNRSLMFTNVQPAHAGIYQVRVQNGGGTVWSLPAALSVATNIVGGALIDFRNRFTMITSNEAPVFDIDGQTRLSGEQYVAQLYAGPTLETIRPAGEPTPFRTGLSAGFFVRQLVTLANVAPGEIAFAQVRAWEASRGASYEEARATGGKFGRSEILEVRTMPPLLPPASLDALQSFSLRAGLPRFSVGVITLVERQPPNTIVWSLQGEPGFRYVVERSSRNDDFVWRPFAVLTNVTGTVTFTDSASSGSGTVLYRARILD